MGKFIVSQALAHQNLACMAVFYNTGFSIMHTHTTRQSNPNVFCLHYILQTALFTKLVVVFELGFYQFQITIWVQRTLIGARAWVLRNKLKEFSTGISNVL